MRRAIRRTGRAEEARGGETMRQVLRKEEDTNERQERRKGKERRQEGRRRNLAGEVVNNTSLSQ